MRKYLLASGIMGLALLGSACSPSEQPESPLPSVSTSHPHQGVTEPSTAVTEQTPLGITRAQYESIVTGMTYEQVVSIVGFPGELSGESTFADQTIKTYQFEGTEPVSFASFMFTNNALDAKNQFGLK